MAEIFDIFDTWSQSGNEGDLTQPRRLAAYLDSKYSPEDRDALAREAAAAAFEEIGPAYRTPHVREAALRAARFALGIVELASTIDERKQNEAIRHALANPEFLEKAETSGDIILIRHPGSIVEEIPPSEDNPDNQGEQ